MTVEREIVTGTDAADAARLTAERFVRFATERGLVEPREDAPAETHIAVSGGSVATSVMPAIVAAADGAGVDWSHVHVWFADERFVPRGHDDRNAAAVASVLRGAKGFVPTHLHSTLSSEIGVSLDEAAAAYERELRVNVPPRSRTPGALPSLDLVLLGAGPDGHTASLFPGRDPEAIAGRVVVAVADSPKPPPERVTLTFDAIDAAQRVWAIVTGEGKAEALRVALTPGVDARTSPLGAVRGTDETLFVVDEAARTALAD
ncbi:6-phosphogluconolactonase [Pseudoclavibacter chungangensis]|uniref:6-phosphogluconolactonase n=1 Tax=Pseudoclavibacter chungangensis TaxID=587635 RepID=A0A7J5BTV9_9MICO|nr:6-phosphogluconolactonase [Pseudoclavibacter chungangensis]KAB1657785.1 6-phosphogluconolactonase [Pseudoclavibacter chungangensis]NYJ66627.1 6-phosphogluconolactonase [Pseudoclavibacter chungangensis]